ncbi:MAG: hypothetical protein ACREQA_21470, partial [Candidatus Binatia bacterium]
MRGQIEPVRVYNFDAVFILFMLLAMASVALLLFIFVPLLRVGQRYFSDGRQFARLPARKLVYFVCVGLGFILVE